MLAYLHLHTLTLAYFALGCFRSSSVRVCVSVEMSVCKCKCRSVSVQGIFRKNPSQCFREKQIRRKNLQKVMLCQPTGGLARLTETWLQAGLLVTSLQARSRLYSG